MTPHCVTWSRWWPRHEAVSCRCSARPGWHGPATAGGPSFRLLWLTKLQSRHHQYLSSAEKVQLCPMDKWPRACDWRLSMPLDIAGHLAMTVPRYRRMRDALLQSASASLSRSDPIRSSWINLAAFASSSTIWLPLCMILKSSVASSDSAVWEFIHRKSLKLTLVVGFFRLLMTPP